MGPRGATSPVAGVLLATISLPAIGAVLAGRDLRTYLRFPPPLEIPLDYPRFSGLAAAAVVVLLGAIAASWARPLATTLREHKRTPAGAAPGRPSRGTFPWWGWLALAWTAAWWVLAWTRFPWFEPAQRHTFFPLWLGYIVVVNAWTEARSGTCFMRRAPARWIALFGASALFWWLFEWLNRFVRNWHYLAVAEYGPLGYAAHATLCFSTVLPAVAATRELLDTHGGFRRLSALGPAWGWLSHRGTAYLLVTAGIVALLCTGAQPLHAYPALWVAPLALAWGWGILRRQAPVPAQLSRGEWRTAAGWMLAAVICGFWWEMWNWHSLAKWIYTVPFVERWHVFEMPLLGYAGYLPFGLECLLVTERFVPDEELAPAPRTRPAA